MISFNGAPTGAHRFSYAIANGSIQVGDNVLHTCDNSKCVRPSHLYIGTHSDNMRDRSERERGPSEFSNGQIEDARQLASDGGNLYEIAEALGIKNTTTLLNAIRGGTFKHVKVGPVKNVDISKQRKVRKLSDKDIADIQAALKSPRWGIQKELAKRYGVSHVVISMIKNGRYKNK